MSRAAVAVLVVVAIAVLGAIMFGGPIVNYWRQRTADAEARQEQAVDDSVGRGLEAEGTQVLAEAAGQETSAVGEIRGRTYVIERETRADPDSATRLPAGALDRLGEHDRLLCDSGVECRPGGPAAPARASGGLD